MEQTSKKMQLQVCPISHRMLLDAPKHDFIYEDYLDDDEELGIEVRGKGRQFTYWVTGASVSMYLAPSPSSLLRPEAEWGKCLSTMSVKRKASVMDSIDGPHSKYLLGIVII